MIDPGEIPERVRDLIDSYCDDTIDDPGVGELEEALRSSESAVRYFATYLQIHAELGFMARARRAATAVLGRPATSRPGRRMPAGIGRASWRHLAAAGAVIAMVGFSVGRLRPPTPARPDVVPHPNVAWLTNAQDCVWIDRDAPGRDMGRGRTLRLGRGLAEIEFERGARVILEGPAALELLSDNSARLISGSMTARVPPAAKGFTIVSPQGKVVDLGTEFGLAVGASGATSVRVFEGELTASVGSEAPVHLLKDQSARMDGHSVALSPRDVGAADFARAIVPPPEILPRVLALDFARPIERTLGDVDGRGIGLSARLPGTGSALPALDPNLRLRPESGTLELTTTRSDINQQVGMPTGEYPGIPLGGLGFTGPEDFSVSVEIPDIPGLEVVGQFGLYAGSRSDRMIRGGVLKQYDPEGYRLFLVNNRDGKDSDLHEVGMIRPGEDLRLTLRRVAGAYSLLAENTSSGGSSTLAISHTDYLDGEHGLFVGLFGANAQSNVSKTLKIRKLTATVLTRNTARTEAGPRP